MIEVRNEDVFLERRASDGRFLLFTKTDVRPGWPLPWWGCVLDTGGDGFGILARWDEHSAPAGWTARQLVYVAHARAEAEARRLGWSSAGRCVSVLREAGLALARLLPGPDPADTVTLAPGPGGGPYPWGVARLGNAALPLCPDPAQAREGVTLEQVITIAHQLVSDAPAEMVNLHLWQARAMLAAAIRHEAARAAADRG